MAKRQSFSLEEAAVNNDADTRPKRSNGPAPSMKRFTMDIPAPLHKKLKIRAVELDSTMADLVCQWIEEKVK